MLVTGEALYRPTIVYDPQREYGDYYNTNINGKIVQVPGIRLPLYRPGLGLKRSRFCGSFDDFVTFVTRKRLNDEGEMQHVLRGYNIVFEESTITLKGGMSEPIRDLVVSRFHDFNNLVFVFHKLCTVPPDLMDLANFVILFKTLDNPKNIEQRFSDDLIDLAFEKQRRKQGDGAPPTKLDRYNEEIDGKRINLFPKT